MKLLSFKTALTTVALVAFSMPAWGDEGKVTEMAKEAKITIDQAIKSAMEKAQGTVVEAELEKKHGKTVWEVEVVGADGQITEVHIDAATGDVIDTEMKKGEKKKEGKKGKK